MVVNTGSDDSKTKDRPHFLYLFDDSDLFYYWSSVVHLYLEGSFMVWIYIYIVIFQLVNAECAEDRGKKEGGEEGRRMQF